MDQKLFVGGGRKDIKESDKMQTRSRSKQIFGYSTGDILRPKVTTLFDKVTNYCGN